MLIKGIVAACGVMLPFAAFGQVLWDQELSSDGLGFASDGISTNGSQFYHQSIADDFNLTGTSNVSGIEFWGGSEDFQFPDLTNFSAFDVYIYNSTFNPVFSTQVSTAALNPTNTGLISAYGGQLFDFKLATSINLNAGTYYVHVGSINVAPTGDAFVWADGATGNNSFYANLFDGNGWQQQTGFGDLAFKITGTAAPEPVGMGLLAVGAVALIRRRKSSR